MSMNLATLSIETPRITSISMSVIMLNAKMLSVAFCHCYAECHYAVCRYAKCMTVALAEPTSLSALKRASLLCQGLDYKLEPFIR
jgi:hypothetical protein